MTISRRKFLVGLGSSLITPTFYDLAIKKYSSTRGALLLKPLNPTITLGAYDWSGEGIYMLFNGEPDLPMPDFWSWTWKDWAENYPDDSYLECWERDGIDLDEQVDQGFAEETWILRYAGNADAYQLLAGLDLGLGAETQETLGGLAFVECPSPGSSYRGVEGDALAMSLLQKRLIDINAGIEIFMGDEKTPEPTSKVISFW